MAVQRLFPKLGSYVAELELADEDPEIAITKTPDEETSPVFSADGQAIYFVRNLGNAYEITRATRKNPKQFWWQNLEFEVSPLYDGPSQITSVLAANLMFELLCAMAI